ncbi:MAG TPA: hypothetical protein VFQ23_14510 [Anaerolineales bacterium]|nr:hypothetical protein [Anaerolineales bacterium]
MLDHSSRDLSRAILQTVAYSDLFDYPLSAREIHRYLTGIKASLEEVVRALREDGVVGQTDSYFTLHGREEIVRIRMQRVFHSSLLLPSAIAYGRMLGNLPYIRMVALTGSLAVMNVSGNPDFDYMLVTTPGRLWIARAFALALNRLARLQGYTLCPNLLVSELALEWPEKDLYSARELCQMIPIAGFDTYRRLLQVNRWIERFLPNAYAELEKTLPAVGKPAGAFQALLEFVLLGNFGSRFEQWEMNRKIARFSKQAGFGEETVFTAEVCQGNFHHHRKWTREMFENKLSVLEKESAVTFKVTVT